MNLDLDHAFVFTKKGGKLESNIKLPARLRKMINAAAHSSRIKRKRAYIEMTQDSETENVSCHATFDDVNPILFQKIQNELYRAWGNAALKEEERKK